MALRKAVAAVAVTAAVGFVVAGCSSSGSGGSAGKPSGSETSAAAASSTAAAPAGFKVDTSKCPKSATTAVAAGQPLKIGTTLPMSGPLAPIGQAAAVGLKAYFGKVNAAGGAAGHKLVLDPKDDGYDPTKTVPATTPLIQQDHVFATLAQTGGPNAVAVEPLAEQSCTPELWTGSGRPELADPAKHPWTTMGLNPYSAEAEAWASYIAAKKPGATVGYMALDNDTGVAYTKYFKQAAAKDGLKIVAAAKQSPTAANIDTEVTTLLAAHPDFAIAMTAGPFCTMFNAGLVQGGFKGTRIGALSCGTLAYLDPAAAAANGQLSIGWNKDPSNAAVAKDPDIVQFQSDLKKYGGASLPPVLQSQALLAYRVAAVLVGNIEAAAKASGGLTQANLMDAAWHTHTKLFAAFGGTGVTNGPSDPVLVEYGVWQRYDGATKSLVATGDVVDVEGKASDYQG